MKSSISVKDIFSNIFLYWDPTYLLQSQKQRIHFRAMVPIFAFIFGSGVILGRRWNQASIRSDDTFSSIAWTRVASSPSFNDLTSSSEAGSGGGVSTKTLQVAWLLSFPNSGTSYTGDLVRVVTGLNSATNYGESNGGEDGNSQAVFVDSNEGPFWTKPLANLSKPTNGYLLTKTHCGGSCDMCGPIYYMKNNQLFLKECLATSYIVKESQGNLRKVVGSYSRELVSRAVHLIRDPFDNVVSRFHLRWNRFTKNNDTQSILKYTRSRDGFRTFCSDLSKMFIQEEMHSNFYGDVLDIVKNVPCYADFFRYVQWHNLAFTMTWDLQLPTMIVHYENYTMNLNGTITNILAFLEQGGINNPPTFIGGKTYREYFTDDEIQAVSLMFSTLAMEKTWYHTKHYFNQS